MSISKGYDCPKCGGETVDFGGQLFICPKCQKQTFRALTTKQEVDKEKARRRPNSAKKRAAEKNYTKAENSYCPCGACTFKLGFENHEMIRTCRACGAKYNLVKEVHIPYEGKEKARQD